MSPARGLSFGGGHPLRSRRQARCQPVSIAAAWCSVASRLSAIATVTLARETPLSS